MMMVDTINPNTGGPDEVPAAATTDQPLQAEVPTDRFYGGFDKPDEVNINLAASGGKPDLGSKEQVPASSNQSVMNDMVTPAPQTATSSMETQTHTTYSNKKPVNTRGILVIVGIGIIATLIFSIGTYFLLGSTNADKINKQQAQLDELKTKLNGLSETPTALAVPETTPEVTPTTPETPEVAPVVTPVETPTIESTETTVPAKTDDSANAAG